MNVELVPTAARLPRDLRDDLEALAKSRDVDLSTVLKMAAREYVDRELHGKPGNGALFRPSPGAARGSDPGTSKRAAALVAPRTGSQRRRALWLIADAGQRGMTADEVIERLELEARHAGHPPPAVNGVAKRVSELAHAGAIVDDGDVIDGPRTRKTRHGSAALVYVATDLGRAWLR